TAEEITLSNQIVISIFPCSWRAPRGFAAPVVCLDEFGFFRNEGVAVDKEIVDALRPAQAQFPNAKLLKLSSPFTKQGELYRDFAERHQRPHHLVFHSSTVQGNPSIRADFLAAEKQRDPIFYEREYEARFSDTASGLFAREAVESCVVKGRFE